VVPVHSNSAPRRSGGCNVSYQTRWGLSADGLSSPSSIVGADRPELFVRR